MALGFCELMVKYDFETEYDFLIHIFPKTTIYQKFEVLHSVAAFIIRMFFWFNRFCSLVISIGSSEARVCAAIPSRCRS